MLNFPRRWWCFVLCIERGFQEQQERAASVCVCVCAAAAAAAAVAAKVWTGTQQEKTEQQQKEKELQALAQPLAVIQVAFGTLPLHQHHPHHHHYYASALLFSRLFTRILRSPRTSQNTHLHNNFSSLSLSLRDHFLTYTRTTTGPQQQLTVLDRSWTPTTVARNISNPHRQAQREREKRASERERSERKTARSLLYITELHNLPPRYITEVRNLLHKDILPIDRQMHIYTHIKLRLLVQNWLPYTLVGHHTGTFIQCEMCWYCAE
jgi:hypothetical protein